ncbi:MAG: hypothetical protein CXX80_03425 [Methanobacteriota archaeon]|nr:MAG: hypothetical protein CXX80_12770 [Euryarchaeota archaeon]PXY75957.1 MAG: hypothetical protein CXX80_03635 [Euryarchaeota archaeon]PXY76083.1 MAG: hypothetical protein CXX80_03425 [Euryarchaeota archaeon]
MNLSPSQLQHQQIDSDGLQGSFRLPIQLKYPVERVSVGLLVRYSLRISLAQFHLDYNPVFFQAELEIPHIEYQYQNGQDKSSQDKMMFSLTKH